MFYEWFKNRESAKTEGILCNENLRALASHWLQEKGSLAGTIWEGLKVLNIYLMVCERLVLSLFAAKKSSRDVLIFQVYFLARENYWRIPMLYRAGSDDRLTLKAMLRLFKIFTLYQWLNMWRSNAGGIPFHCFPQLRWTTKWGGMITAHFCYPAWFAGGGFSIAAQYGDCLS
ncbi:hypothetical protein BGW36DRAFT_358798 [Talaromyces proteolyticus]|uniref:Uncharacterized protein n=1 Tax=Talaromyces proteolyticus TaxID=1131652 RepID=A0AAD4Q228_9EURO|nr:uncharacterized protein BGW36DRAFT_358798 [Talaromyces proteolyticus]KAH8699299.1 hypothetical protein BGW36DRAFT_358798 [Talaromyces proteolyticus]